MAIRDDFAPGEVLAAGDLNDTFASKLPYEYSDTEPTTTTDGFLWYDDNDTPPTPKFWDGAVFQALGGAGGGKVLQVVRATDSSFRTTTSTSFVDITGLSVTITPQKSDSAILLLLIVGAQKEVNNEFIVLQITDNSNNAISGAESGNMGANGTTIHNGIMAILGYSTPATTSATTYKARFRSNGGGTVRVLNAEITGQLYAIEVGA